GHEGTPGKVRAWPAQGPRIYERQEPVATFFSSVNSVPSASGYSTTVMLYTVRPDSDSTTSPTSSTDARLTVRRLVVAPSRSSKPIATSSICGTTTLDVTSPEPSSSRVEPGFTRRNTTSLSSSAANAMVRVC